MFADEPLVLASSDLSADVDRLVNGGFRLEMITPADSPRIAELSGHGLRVRIDTTVELSTKQAPADHDDLKGRAGMYYRDLLPDRDGGRVIASHITIPGTGPVNDYVHHHEIDLQFLYVVRGQVKVVYEDQGEPFWMSAGDCVLQPPHIRHQVLESVNDCEVFELASPSQHPTFVDHDLVLPTATLNPDRDFGGQRFMFDKSADETWLPASAGWEQRILGVSEASNGAGSGRLLRAHSSEDTTGPEATPSEISIAHDEALTLLFGLDGICEFAPDATSGARTFSSGDTISLRPGSPGTLLSKGEPCSILEVRL